MPYPKTPNLQLNKVDRSSPNTTLFNTKPLIDDNVDIIDAVIPLSNMARQAIINGNFDVWQRGLTFTNPTSGSFTADRYRVSATPSGGTLPSTISHSRQQSVPGEVSGANYFYRISISDAGTGFSSAAEYNLRQTIENGTRLLCGAGKKVTISFYARSSIPNKKIGVFGFQYYGSGGSPIETLNGKNFTLSSNWMKYNVTLITNSLTGKTFGDNDQLLIEFSIMWGAGNAARVGDSIAETFGGAGNIDISQVQLCAGDVALSFQPRHFADELALCQRYYEYLDIARVRYLDAASGVVFSRDFRPKRIAPTVTITTINGVAPTLDSARASSVSLVLTNAGITDSTYTLKLDAEL
ncbi:hypothetical protein [Paenibacillus elgii]|uniref:hypothetical protein n=1 Tax=Paenibacillus elgii TaxID=189691 RepID=UPI000248D6B2|nr:hypothetical protein [Paenibacillus elgii]